MPYLTHIFGKKLNERYLRTLIAQEVKAVVGVADLQNLAIDLSENERAIVINFNAILTNQTRITINQTIGV